MLKIFALIDAKLAELVNRHTTIKYLFYRMSNYFAHL